MRDMVADLQLRAGDVIGRDQVIEWFAKHYPRVKEGTIAAHLIRQSTNARTRLHYTPRPGDDDLFFQIDSSRFRLYQPTSDPPPITRASIAEAASEPARPTGESLVPESSEFAYERDLRNFLSKNLHQLEPGLEIYEDEGINGIEFPAGGRFIDILAVDQAKNYVVIELKVSRGYDRVVGQLLRYMAWIEQHHAEPAERVRGIIVAKDISEDLRLACSRVRDVSLFEYELAVKLRRIAGDHTSAVGV